MNRFSKLTWPLISALLLVLLTAPLAVCRDLKLECHWRDRDVSIDGFYSEWTGAANLIEDKHISIGLMNDDEYLYVSIVTHDIQIQRQAMFRGLIVWFDPNGGHDKVLGVKFPIGTMGSGMQMRRVDQEFDPGDFEKRLLESAKEFEVLGPDKDSRRRISIDNDGDIAVRLGMTNASLIYELRVPLHESSDHEIALNAKDEKRVGIGVENPEFERDQRPSGFHGRFGGGMGGGPRGGMGRPPEGRPGFERPKPLKVWCKVDLAKALSTPPDNQNTDQNENYNSGDN